jgi:hypothetical protein
MKKESIGDRHSLECYFNNYENLPQTWIETRNFVFDYGQVVKLNTGDKHTAYTEKKPLRTPLQTSEVVKKTAF